MPELKMETMRMVQGQLDSSDGEGDAVKLYDPTARRIITGGYMGDEQRSRASVGESRSREVDKERGRVGRSKGVPMSLSPPGEVGRRARALSPPGEVSHRHSVYYRLRSPGKRWNTTRYRPRPVSVLGQYR